MQAKPVADGQQPMTSADVVCKVLCVSLGTAGNNFFLKNASIQTNSTRAKTSAERMLWEQLVAEQESSATLADQVDELKRKTKIKKGSWRNIRNDNRRSTIISVSCARASDLLVTLSL
jgi:uncharacterized protein YlxW (UPF0749 family)